MLDSFQRSLLSSSDEGNVFVRRAMLIRAKRGQLLNYQHFGVIDLVQLVNVDCSPVPRPAHVCRLLLLTLSTGEFGWGGTSVKQ